MKPRNPKQNIVKMHANESPYPLPRAVLDQTLASLSATDLSRYPDTDSTELRRAIGDWLDFPAEQIIVGNGSDEMIDVLIKTFVAAGDAVVSHDPTFSMYQAFTEVIGGRYYGVSAPAGKDAEVFPVNIPGLIDRANDVGAKVAFLCTPNNPTGQRITKDQVLKVLAETKARVVIDEAYREFSDQDFLPLLKNGHPRLMILRTFSKANGLAGVRGGYLLGPEKEVEAMQRVKPPYNLNVFTQQLLTRYISYIQSPEGRALMKERIEEICRGRDRLYRDLEQLPGFIPYCGEGNFIPFSVKKHRAKTWAGGDTFDETLDEKLLLEGFQIKKFHHQETPYYRISVGTPEENRRLTETLQRLYGSRVKLR